MHKKVLSLLVIFVLVSGCFGCAHEENLPMCISFKNQSVLGSPNYAFTTVYLEDKRIRDFSTDLHIMANRSVTLNFGKELEEPTKLFISEPNRWLSLTQLLNLNSENKLKYSTFAQAETTTFVLSANEKVNLKFKGVAGNLEYDLKNNMSKLVDVFDVSKPFEIEIKNVK